MKILIEGIPKEKMRYGSWGDWSWQNDQELVINVQDSLPQDQWLSVVLHELVEAILCQKRGIPEQVVTRFDMEQELLRAAGSQETWEDPGDHPKAPYRKEHVFATVLERMFFQELIR